jgi:hypothetical protein
MCREIAALTDKPEASVILEELTRDFEVEGAQLERKARQMRTTIKTPATHIVVDSTHEGVSAVLVPPSDFEDPESS